MKSRKEEETDVALFHLFNMQHVLLKAFERSSEVFKHLRRQFLDTERNHRTESAPAEQARDGWDRQIDVLFFWFTEHTALYHIPEEGA